MKKYTHDDSGNIYRNEPEQVVIATITSDCTIAELAVLVDSLNGPLTPAAAFVQSIGRATRVNTDAAVLLEGLNTGAKL